MKGLKKVKLRAVNSNPRSCPKPIEEKKIVINVEKVVEEELTASEFVEKSDKIETKKNTKHFKPRNKGVNFEEEKDIIHK